MHMPGRDALCVSVLLIAGWTIGTACAFAADIEFDVALSSELDSKTAKAGQAVEARLVGDLRDGSKVLAKSGSKVLGKVTEVYGNRRLLHSELSTKRWMRAGAGIAMEFDQVVPAHGTPLKIHALPLNIVEADGKVEKGNDDVTVSKQGTVEASRKKDLKPKFGRSILGVASFVAAPVTAVAGAAVGAARPSTVLPDATDDSAKSHRRLKGMATGLVAGLPGGFLVNDTALKGQQAVLKSGTRLKLQWTR
jgi:hypothetical protein